jgi:hypothetical protein
VAITRKNRLLALCLGTVLVFFAQSMFCFADQLGMASCCGGDHAEHQNTSSSDGSFPASCCQHGSALVVQDLPGLPVRHFSIGVIFQADDIAPDGPVQKIDYPPQLS